MRFWYMNSWAYVSLAGLIVMVLALKGIGSDQPATKVAARIVGALFGLAIIIFGIWMNLRSTAL